MRRLHAHVRKLRRVIDDGKSHNAGDTVEADYFALEDLINYYDETRDASRNVVRAREALRNVMFCRDDR